MSFFEKLRHAFIAIFDAIEFPARNPCPDCSKELSEDRGSEYSVGGGFHCQDITVYCPHCGYSREEKGVITMMYGN